MCFMNRLKLVYLEFWDVVITIKIALGLNFCLFVVQMAIFFIILQFLLV